ncbi:MAG: galactose-1-phosphate uridylyltransferase [Elusimicrobiota bacterium]
MVDNENKPVNSGIYELRWNPFLGWWVMYASSRQKRPLLPKDYCPFCPGSGKVPQKYDVMMYNNDFPILRLDPPKVKDIKNAGLAKIVKTARSYGKCEVILYSSEHQSHIGSFTDDKMFSLMNLWKNRYQELGNEKKVKYVYIFENRGEVVGVTIPHPHGQVYAYPFIPKKVELELRESKRYHQKNKSCIHCDLVKAETEIQDRVVMQSKYFTVFIPYFAEYPYQVWIVPGRHFQNILQMSSAETDDLAITFRTVVKMYDALFNMPFPYMMCLHQEPVDGKNYTHYHFHIEFYPPLRSQVTQKFNAGSETGAWVHGNPSSPEEKAEELRQVLKKVEGK